ncbi:MAG TPA: nucleotide sugar dehydrogenase [Methanothrix soehngenii]|nr:nucleotide sugar dehydrogenase [Methanothrix soehngenii]
MKIAVVGLGKAGLPLASVIAESGLEVVGIDVDERRCEMINDGINPVPEETGLDELIKKHGGKRLFASPRYEDAGDCNNFIIIVPLFIDERHHPDFGILESAFRSVGKILKRGDLAVLETTVPPRTTETMVRSWLEDESGLQLGDFHLAHSPERIMTGYSISRLREFPKIVGGADDESGRCAFDLYRKFIPNLQMVSSSRVAEFVKIIEGSYRDVNIALANEILKISDELDIDFHEAREYANHDYCHIHLPSTGVGGHCIPVYPWFLINEMEKREKFGFAELQRNSRKINDEMVGHWAEKIILEGLKIDKPLSQIRICLKGITYRKGVKGLYHSRNLALAKLLAQKGLQIGVYDELFSEEEIENLSLRFMDPKDADVVFDCFELRFSRSPFTPQ